MYPAVFQCKLYCYKHISCLSGAISYFNTIDLDVKSYPIQVQHWQARQKPFTTEVSFYELSALSMALIC